MYGGIEPQDRSHIPPSSPFGGVGFVQDLFGFVPTVPLPFDSPPGLAGMLLAIILLSSASPASPPDDAIIGMTLSAIETIYGDTDEGCDMYRVIMEHYAMWPVYHKRYSAYTPGSAGTRVRFWVIQFSNARFHRTGSEKSLG